MNPAPSAKYSFLPWMKKRIASEIIRQEAFADTNGLLQENRASIGVTVQITKDTGPPDSIPQTLEILGPGDVVGIDSRVIQKTEPANWITNFEPNLFPFIEFYEEDFPWRFTPASPVGQKLRPWITLVILKENEFERNDILSGPLPSIKIADGPTSAVFPNPAQIWAWAHVHVNGNVDDDPATHFPNLPGGIEYVMQRFREMVNENPDRAYSRILCPRKLEQNTGYYAFLIPSFESGRLAGLGAEDSVITAVQAQTPSFGIAQTEMENQWPVYHEWFFKTGATGDFEYMVRQIHPRMLSEEVGKRKMDIQDPGFTLNLGAGTPNSDGTLDLEGAFRIAGAGATTAPYPWPNMDQIERAKLRDLLNLGEDLNDANVSLFFNSNPFAYATPPLQIEDDPIILPPVYGRWHALRKRVEEVGATPNLWLNELNMDPRNRVVAGLGAEYVRKNQDHLMDKAWEQLGDVIEGNRKLRWAQLAHQVSTKTFEKHISSQPAEQHVMLLGKLQSKILNGAVTHYKITSDSAQPLATLDPAYRRLQRPHGPILRKVDSSEVLHNQNNLVTQLADLSLNTVEPKVVSNEQFHVPQSEMWQNVHTSVNANSMINTAVFDFVEYGETNVTPDAGVQSNFMTALQPLANYFLAGNWPAFSSGNQLVLNNVKGNMNNSVHPKTTIPKRIYEMVAYPANLPQPPPDKIVPVMAYPVIDTALFEGVRELGMDYLLPNLTLIPNNSISLLETNQKFVEAFLVGANHEFSRELLWREFPTDQRGSYFRRFWDVSDYVDTLSRSPEDVVSDTYDIEKIHEWPSNTILGTHPPANREADTLVLVIRGDLLKKFPNAVLYAQKAKYQSPGGIIDLNLPRELDTPVKYPIFSAKIEPDITFVGFSLDANTAKGDRTDANEPGWFFILKERPGETRFGIDSSIGDPLPDLNSWSDLNWDHLDNTTITATTPEFGPPPLFPAASEYINLANTVIPVSNIINDRQIVWAENSASMAAIFYQQPVMVAIHANEMIP